MTWENLATAGINCKDGTKRFCGQAALYEKYLVRFPSDLNYQNMMLALEQKDYGAALTYAHALKGLAGNLSLDTLHARVTPLVQALRAGQLSEVEQLSEAVAQSYQVVVKSIAASTQA